MSLLNRYKFLMVGCSIFFLSLLSFAESEPKQASMIANKLAHQVSGFVEAKAKADYEQKLKSVQGLLFAHKRITDLNLDSVKESMLQKKVQPLIKKSKKLAEEHRFKEAKTELDQAYFTIATSIKSQRTGQTLVRSLDFATEKEAYEYELGRYENYKMLVNMMIDERHAFERDDRTKPFFDEEDRYHVQAVELAQKGQYGEAAKLIEQASKSLVNLLRDSGVYIPGA
ncbi:hypothetical protein MNBD_GAMMA03-1850 [hydrothermal vent metagenome]|uniref:Uncharacterized protein n=1 Tax=hydrothermal vent metagenome TaxID=652676 RepID=A0A3B0W0N0_9ZZZZ